VWHGQEYIGGWVTCLHDAAIMLTNGGGHGRQRAGTVVAESAHDEVRLCVRRHALRCRLLLLAVVLVHTRPLRVHDERVLGA
jgi:hypothetical protein